MPRTLARVANARPAKGNDALEPARSWALLTDVRALIESSRQRAAVAGRERFAGGAEGGSKESRGNEYAGPRPRPGRP